MKNKKTSINSNSSKEINSSYIPPFVFIVALAFVFGSLLFVVYQDSVKKQNQNVELLTERCAKTIELKLEGNLDYLKLIASERAEGNLSETNFQIRVSEYLNDHSEFINITWIDSTFTIKTVSPLKGNAHIIGLKIEMEEPKRVSRLAKQKKQAIYTKPFEAIQSGVSFELWLPIFVENRFIGLFAGVYSCDRLLKNTIQIEHYNKTHFSFLDANSSFISGDTPHSNRNADIIYEQELISLKNGLKLQIQSAKSSSFDSTMLILITLCVLLIAGLLYSFWIIKTENNLRKKIQNTLLKNKNLLRKQNEELIHAINKAEESETLFKAMTDTSPLAIYMSSGTHQKAQYINPSFTNLFGYKMDEVPSVAEWWPLAYPNKSYRELVEKEWQDKIKIAIEKNCQIEPMETNVTCKDGTLKVISWGFVSTGFQNWAFGLDLTKNRKAQEELFKAKEKAEESDRLKSAFLANMSHEIRTPMNGILGFAELLKSPNLTGEKQSDYINIIEKSGERMLNIINDIINISKIEAGLMDLKMDDSNVNKQLEYIYTFFKPEIENKGLQFYLKNQLDIDIIIKTDKEKVYALLTNLVKNAIKFTQFGSIEIGCKEQNEFIEFYVKDTGMGIEREMQKNIFKRFIQVDVNDKNAYQGAGLGLAISKSYIEMLGGKLWVKSELGRGSTFFFNLPFQSNSKPTSSDDKNETYKKINMTKIKALIVEDDEASRRLITIAIENLSNDIIYAKNGQEAVNICRKNPDLDLILMDIQMPIMNGYIATSEIRKFNKDVVIIAQTAYALEGDEEKAIAAGCSDYISKPIKRNILCKLIIKHLNLNS